MVNPIPDEYPRITAYLCVDGAADAIDFYTSVFGFTERHRMTFDGRIGHCELALDGSMIMLSDETYAAALAAGATELRPVQDQFYGDRSGQFEDPWGHRWGVATHVEDVDDEELERRAAAMMSGDDG